MNQSFSYIMAFLIWVNNRIFWNFYNEKTHCGKELSLASMKISSDKFHRSVKPWAYWDCLEISGTGTEVMGVKRRDEVKAEEKHWKGNNGDFQMLLLKMIMWLLHMEGKLKQVLIYENWNIFTRFTCYLLAYGGNKHSSDEQHNHKGLGHKDVQRHSNMFNALFV